MDEYLDRISDKIHSYILSNPDYSEMSLEYLLEISVITQKDFNYLKSNNVKYNYSNKREDYVSYTSQFEDLTKCKTIYKPCNIDKVSPHIYKFYKLKISDSLLFWGMPETELYFLIWFTIGRPEDQQFTYSFFAEDAELPVKIQKVMQSYHLKFNKISNPKSKPPSYIITLPHDGDIIHNFCMDTLKKVFLFEEDSNIFLSCDKKNFFSGVNK